MGRLQAGFRLGYRVAQPLRVVTHVEVANCPCPQPRVARLYLSFVRAEQGHEVRSRRSPAARAETDLHQHRPIHWAIFQDGVDHGDEGPGSARGASAKPSKASGPKRSPAGRSSLGPHRGRAAPNDASRTATNPAERGHLFEPCRRFLMHMQVGLRQLRDQRIERDRVEWLERHGHPLAPRVRPGPCQRACCVVLPTRRLAMLPDCPSALGQPGRRADDRGPKKNRRCL
jgi:hypothetical protein